MHAPPGLYSLPANSSVSGALTVDLSNSRNLESVLRQLGKALAFPDWYGANLDALYDCLSDPDWAPPAEGIVLLNGMAAWRDRQPEKCSLFFEVLTLAIRERAETADAPAVLIDLEAPNIPPWPSP